jgi:hypothetical protein
MKSINLDTDDVITVFIRKTFILVPVDTSLLSRLKASIWPTEIVGATYRFLNLNLFNKIIEQNRLMKKRINETSAFFGVHYRNSWPISIVLATFYNMIHLNIRVKLKKHQQLLLIS